MTQQEMSLTSSQFKPLSFRWQRNIWDWSDWRGAQLALLASRLGCLLTLIGGARKHLGLAGLDNREQLGWVDADIQFTLCILDQGTHRSGWRPLVTYLKPFCNMLQHLVVHIQCPTCCCTTCDWWELQSHVAAEVTRWLHLLQHYEHLEGALFLTSSGYPSHGATSV